MLYLNRTWADRIENPGTADIEAAFTELQQQDEQGAFWLETENEELVLEVQQDLTLTLIICGEICRTTRCSRQQPAEELFQLLLRGEEEKVKEEFDCL